MKVKKQSDGNYYKKIVTWRKNNESGICIHFGWALFGLFIGLFIGLIATEKEAMIDVVMVSFIMSLVFFVGYYFETHDRKVKFERIGK